MLLRYLARPGLRAATVHRVLGEKSAAPPWRRYASLARADVYDNGSSTEQQSAEATLRNYNKKNCSGWFSAEIASYDLYGVIKYAGQTMTAHQYHVY